VEYDEENGNEGVVINRLRDKCCTCTAIVQVLFHMFDTFPC